MSIKKSIWYFNHGKSAKYDGDVTITPSMGFNWFFWFPRYTYNGGSVFRHEVFDFHINWLCYWIGITIYANQNGNKSDNQVGSLSR